MSKRYSGKSFKDSSVMKKPKLSLKEKRKLKKEKAKKLIFVSNDIELSKSISKISELNNIEFSFRRVDNDEKNLNFRRASTNIPRLSMLSDKGLNVRDLISYDTIFIEKKSIEQISKRLS